MPDIEPFSPRGMFHEGWTAEVNDYAIACGWALKGKQFIVGDVAGGLFAFEGDSGKIIWKKENTHSGGLLAMAIHPEGEIFATSGQEEMFKFVIAMKVKLLKHLILAKVG